MKRSDIAKYVLCPQSRNVVRVRGEPLHPILWQGKQWAVTDYGLECRDGTYHVAANAFWYSCNLTGEITADQVFVSWWKHLSGKNWCDKDDVDNALQAMLVLFNRNGTRTNVRAPILTDEADVEDYAMQAGERAYQEARRRAMDGMPE